MPSHIRNQKDQADLGAPDGASLVSQPGRGAAGGTPLTAGSYTGVPGRLRHSQNYLNRSALKSLSMAKF